MGERAEGGKRRVARKRKGGTNRSEEDGSASDIVGCQQEVDEDVDGQGDGEMKKRERGARLTNA